MFRIDAVGTVEEQLQVDSAALGSASRPASASAEQKGAGAETQREAGAPAQSKSSEESGMVTNTVTQANGSTEAGLGDMDLSKWAALLDDVPAQNTQVQSGYQPGTALVNRHE